MWNMQKKAAKYLFILWIKNQEICLFYKKEFLNVW